MPGKQVSAAEIVDFELYTERMEDLLEIDVGNSLVRYYKVEDRISKCLDAFDAEIESLWPTIIPFRTMKNAACV